MAEKKEKTYPSQLDKVKEITDQLEAGLEKLFDSDAFKQYLTTLSKFHDYSLNNTLLIAMQKPDATLVAGYTAWQKQFGRQVLKGAKAIRILAPAPYKKKMEVDKTGPHTGEILTELQWDRRPMLHADCDSILDHIQEVQEKSVLAQLKTYKAEAEAAPEISHPKKGQER